MDLYEGGDRMYKAIIIDDDPQVRIINRDYILKSNSSISVEAMFEDGFSALSYINEGNMVDLIILDIKMDDMDGFEFAAKLRETGNRSQIIIITGSSKTEHIRSARLIGATDYILKPFDNQRMAKGLEKFIYEFEKFNKKSLSHEEIDSIFNPQSDKNETDLSLLEQKILDYLKANRGQWLSVQQVASYIGNTPQTARVYLKGLAENGLVSMTKDFRTNGKPAFIFKYD